MLVEKKFISLPSEKQGCSNKRAEIIPLEPEQVMLLRKLISMTRPLFFH
jgi:hypothetical protein